MVDGQELLGGRIASAAALMSDPNREPANWDEVPPASYLPAQRLKAMDAAGIDYSVLYPTVAGVAGEAFSQLRDTDLERACAEAYNDWLIQEWGAASERFIPQCIVPTWPIEATVAEIHRAVGLGHRGVVFPAGIMDLRDVPHIADADWDPVWSACEELDVPLCLHAGSSAGLQYAPPRGLNSARAQALDAMKRPVSMAYVLNVLLFSRLLMRHPRLRVVLAESGISWVTCDLEWSDHEAAHDGLAEEGFDLTPSQMFRRQVYLNAWYDPVAGSIDYLGSGNILWSTNVPQANSSWPKTRETIERCFRDVASDERDQILWENAAKLYKV
jgi:predicted TIM-barrel fold metal-dependent hydrolase